MVRYWPHCFCDLQSVIFPHHSGGQIPLQYIMCAVYYRQPRAYKATCDMLPSVARMSSLPPRLRCLHGTSTLSSACQCSAWVPLDHSLDLSVMSVDLMVPSNPTDRCGYCTHPWFSHQGESQIRGGCVRTYCGGFIWV